MTAKNTPIVLPMLSIPVIVVSFLFCAPKPTNALCTIRGREPVLHFPKFIISGSIKLKCYRDQGTYYTANPCSKLNFWRKS